MSELIKPIPEGANRGWRLSNRPEPAAELTSFQPSEFLAQQSHMGITIRYGQGPEGYDRFIVEEPNGGGSVTIPYIFINGELYIGANQQLRSTTGGYVTEVPRGFSLPKEPHDVTAKRELEEETGIVSSLSERICDLGGKPINVNTTYFVANPHKGEGVKLYGLELKPEELVIRRDSKNPKLRVYKFSSDLQKKITEANEKIKPEGVRFFHVDLLRNTADGFTHTAISRIITSPKHDKK